MDAFTCVLLCFYLLNLSPCVVVFLYRVPWCVATHDAAGAERCTGHHGWRASWWEEKQSGTAQQHPGGPEQRQRGENTFSSQFTTRPTFLLPITCGLTVINLCRLPPVVHHPPPTNSIYASSYMMTYWWSDCSGLILMWLEYYCTLLITLRHLGLLCSISHDTLPAGVIPREFANITPNHPWLPTVAV